MCRPTAYPAGAASASSCRSRVEYRSLRHNLPKSTCSKGYVLFRQVAIPPVNIRNRCIQKCMVSALTKRIDRDLFCRPHAHAGAGTDRHSRVFSGNRLSTPMPRGFQGGWPRSSASRPIFARSVPARSAPRRACAPARRNGWAVTKNARQAAGHFRSSCFGDAYGGPDGSLFGFRKASCESMRARSPAPFASGSRSTNSMIAMGAMSAIAKACLQNANITALTLGNNAAPRISKSFWRRGRPPA